MSELEKIIAELRKNLGLSVRYYVENARAKDVPACDFSFEGVADDGQHTYFRFLHKNTGYVGVLDGATATERNYAALLPSYIESFAEKEGEWTKTEFLRRILRGECSSMSVYKYMSKYSLRGMPCFVVSLRVPRLLKETLAVLEQYGGNSLDTALPMQEDGCVLVKFLRKEDGEYRSSIDYAEYLVQILKEELGIDVLAGVGATVGDLKDVGTSYVGAENALRYADVFDAAGNVHSYREFLLVKLLDDLPESRLAEYLSELFETSLKEVFDDEEMLRTAETFLQCSLNVSETSRNLYMHRNTLLYRLDKIEKTTGLNIRSFSDAVSFRVLTILHKLSKK